MVTASIPKPASALTRAALMSAILAVVAGLLGMHVLAGAHASHASIWPSGSGTDAASTASDHTAFDHPASGHAASGHAESGHPGPAALHQTPEPTSSCVCGGDCGDQHVAHATCTPAPSGASLSAPPPGTTVLANQPRTTPATDQAQPYSHLPATPTPSELSISRT